MATDGKIIDYSAYNFNNSTIIRPPDGQVSENRRHTRYVIDSRDRDRVAFPTPSKYEITLDEEIEDVLSAELLLAEVPFSGYLFHATNNTIAFTYQGTSYQASVEIGDYESGTDLASSLQTALNAGVGVGNPFTVTYNSRNAHVRIEAAQAFSISPTPSQARILGFDGSMPTYTATLTGGVYVLSSQYRINMEANKYIVMQIDSMAVNKSINNVINKSFALISRENHDKNSMRMLEIKKTFNPPVAKLSKVRIAFYDYDGHLYDFQNHDHRIELLFTSFKHTRRYQFQG